MSEKQSPLTVTNQTDSLPKFKRFSAKEMLVPHLATQPFHGTETTDNGMPEGTDTRTPGFTQQVQE